MKDFFKTFCASAIGVIVGIFLIGLIIAGIIGAALSSDSAPYQLKDNTILKLDLNCSISDRKSDSPLASLLGGSNSFSLDEVLSAIKKAKTSNEVKGIYIKGSGLLNTGVADLESIRKALADFKESGKFIIAYGDTYSQADYYLSSVADEIILNPQGALDFHGLGSVIEFSKGKYEKIGIKFQVFKVGTFKSAVEPYIQDKMSDASRQQISSYLNDIWGTWLKGISESRNISTEQLNNYADECLMFAQADQLLNYQMIDTTMYLPEVDKHLKEKVGIETTKKLTLASVSDLASLEDTNIKESDNTIAILYAEGIILDDAGSGITSLMLGNVITPKEYVNELIKLRDNDKVKAVVFRVNSPGGSAYASEQIWNAVKEVKAKKPIIVSMGTYAASGGYYISVGADSIVAEPTTLTGSIGIYGLIPDGSELAKKMGVTFDEVKTNKNSNFGGRTFGIPFLISAQSRGLNTEESELLQKYIEKGYDLFVTRCADGRSMTKAQIDSIAQGRVWTGQQALEIGLVDKIGGLNDAITIAKEKANLTDYTIAKFPKQKDLMSTILEQTKQSSAESLASFWMGKDEYEQSKLLQELSQTDIRRAEIPYRISY